MRAMRHGPIDPELFKCNRQRLREQLPDQSIVTIRANDIMPTNADGTMPYPPPPTPPAIRIRSTAVPIRHLSGSSGKSFSILGPIRHLLHEALVEFVGHVVTQPPQLLIQCRN